MADGYALALQKAVYSHLSANAELAAIVGVSIGGRALDEWQRPYVIIFEGRTVRPIRSDCGAAATVTFSIVAHAHPDFGKTQAENCRDIIVESLDKASLSPLPYDLVRLQYVTDTIDMDNDGASYSAIVAFEALLDG